MKLKLTSDRFFSQRRQFRRCWKFLQKMAVGMCLIITIWLASNTIAIISASSKPVDAFFVLGGSISREVYVAAQAKLHPEIPILISHGSPAPCIWLICQQQAVLLENVWLEECADSTFGNFYYSIPILRRWGVHKVKLITSPTHLPRAKWMAQILFGANGIWMEPEIIQEKGIPGNRESWLKTGLDVTRSLLWAPLSRIIQPQCLDVTKLADVDMNAWKSRGFKCERQGGI
ncbi:MAG: YdcF family protein [Cyanomargarita calcarea GSE-NOS-MK-12-04C]|uniref:YdcF family protein n=1 Tax=Cyanomargarita calcarea GSE-NOS-MK-12-04C TaxID=2839659 RepID=A0A951QKM0_9CYAN|nr:YdcF family protein [Cyanomargarita calcarea GSE-NOS-MK-12-04C]